jgi:hypothetical protein
MEQMFHGKERDITMFIGSGIIVFILIVILLLILL